MRRSYVIAAAIAIVAGGWLATGQLQNGGTAPAAPAKDVNQAEMQADPAATGAGQSPEVLEQKIVRVQVTTLSASEQQRAIVLRGRTQADRVVNVSAQTDGAVIEIKAEEGSVVKRGDVLAVLDGADRASRLEEARALLKQREIETGAAVKLAEQGFAPKLNLADMAAKVALAKAAVMAMEVEVGYLTIAAPIDGSLDERPAEIGQFLQRGDPVATIVDLDPIVIVGNATEQDVGLLSLSTRAGVRLLDGREYQGQVRFIAARADESTRTFRIEVAVANPDHQILDGLSAELTLPVGKVLAHHVSPAVLSLSEDGEVGVKFVDQSNVVRFAPIAIVREDRDGVWLAGLPSEVRLIVVGQDFVKEGQMVAPVETGPLPADSQPQ